MSTPTDTQAAKMETVRKLLNKAERTDNEHERRALEEQAARIMARYDIDEELINSTRTQAERETPTTTVFEYATWQWEDACRQMLRAIADYAGVRLVTLRGDGYRASFTGFAADVSYAEMLFNAAKLQLLAKMSPSWDPRRTEDENITILYEGGWKWRAIAREAGMDWPDGGKLIRAYKRQCKRENREPLAVAQKDVFVKSFTEAYVGRLQTRLWELTDVRKKEQAAHQHETGVSSALVLAGRDEQIDAALWARYPTLHPDAIQRKRLEEELEFARQVEAAAEARKQMLDTMTEKQREAFLGKEQRERERSARWTKADEQEYQRQQRRDYGASRLGRQAADSVKLGRSSGVGGRSNQELS